MKVTTELTRMDLVKFNLSTIPGFYINHLMVLSALTLILSNRFSLKNSEILDSTIARNIHNIIFICTVSIVFLDFSVSIWLVWGVLSKNRDVPGKQTYYEITPDGIYKKK